MSRNDDYVFRFKLEPNPSVQGDGDPLTETIRSFLDDFLKIGFFTNNGARISVDGFALLNDKTAIHKIFSD